jgi:ABC-type bacteriocin/lantibiotic exporter with double-glycine peptidase domain
MKSFRFSRKAQLPVDRTDELVTNYLDARTRHFKILLTQYWALIFFKLIITTSMLVVGGVLLVQNQINIGQFVASEILILTVLSAVEKLIQSLDKIYDVLTSAEKLGKILDKPLEEEGTLPLDGGTAPLSVAMQQVQFGYEPGITVLKNISFRLEGGEKLCLVGNAGSGKSTLLRLLTGAFSSFEGAILINDIPLQNYTKEDIRAATGILFQQQDIFQGTLLQNITLGDPSITPAAILELSRQLGMENFITPFKIGFDTQVDPLGKRLSGSVIRKILLLRALIGAPRLLLLEEPWQGLDEITAGKIKQYLVHQLPQTTVIVATNDTSFARMCNKVMMLQEGVTENFGKPSDLL